LLHLVGIISLLSMMHGTTNINYLLSYAYTECCCLFYLPWTVSAHESFSYTQIRNTRDSEMRFFAILHISVT